MIEMKRTKDGAFVMPSRPLLEILLDEDGNTRICQGGEGDEEFSTVIVLFPEQIGAVYEALKALALESIQIDLGLRTKGT